MSDDQHYLPRPGMNEKTIVEEMIGDKHPEHWRACSDFVNHSVHAKATNIPGDYHEDIAQEALYKIEKGLPHFRFQCTLRTWVNLIVERCIIDEHRKLSNEERKHFSLTDQPIESDREDEGLIKAEEKSAEDAFMLHDEIQKGWAAVLEYANKHSNPVRDRHILWMVVREGKTQAETAVAVGCSAPVVGYVVREAQRYAREKLGHKL